ncbi:MAG: Jag N-terminal domain-containing protein [Clostridia bacterium]|nr:Jag N-terminal domain-containing protein [Clostridia bacterium]
MKTLESQGKTVDEAIFCGLDQMGLSIDEVDIEIIQEGGKGFLGIGAKQCIVRLTEREKADVERILMEQAAELAREKEEKAQRAQERRAERAERPKHAQRDHGGKQEGHSRRHDERRSGRSRHAHDEEPVEERVLGEPCDGGEEAAFLREVLTRMGLNATVECFHDDSSLYMRVSGNNMGILIGRRGDTLNALQYLTSLVANRKEGPFRRIVVDTENYRTKRDQTLVRLAKRMASDVARTGKPVTMEPMNPYERRILHSTLQDHPSVTTYSEGEEPQRRVVIARK